MPAFHELAPADPQLDRYAFFTDDARGRRVARVMYAHLACPSCGKVDEDKALALGLDPAFVVSSKRDWVSTADDQICVSRRFADFVQSSGFGGLRFIETSGSEHLLAVCTRRVVSDPALVGFVEKGRCPNCQRATERFKGPFMAGLAAPADEATFFAADVPNENHAAAYRPIFASGPVVKALKAGKFKGIDYIEAF